MSKHETWRTRQYWDQIGGLLIEEYMAVIGNKSQAKRPIDGLIVLGHEKAIHSGNTYDITGKDVVIIQAKAGRLGMYLLGQAYFSKYLIERHKPKSVRTVAICGRGDDLMCELARNHGIEVVIIP